MSFKIKREKDVAEGDYLARLSEVTPQTSQYGECIRFQFEVLDGEFATQEVSMLHNAKLQMGNKLDRALVEMGIDTSTVTDELDVDVLKGKLFKIKVVHKTSTKGKVFANVVSARPTTSNFTPTTAPAAPLATPAPTPARQTVPAARQAPVANQTLIEDVPF
jgi:hypothetical protein